MPYRAPARPVQGGANAARITPARCDGAPDNGVPFASAHAVYGLSKLAAWWLRLGIEDISTEIAGSWVSLR